MEDFIKELHYRAIDSRFKRISDTMAQDIRKLYNELDIDIEPNWYLIFMLLNEHTKLSIVDIAKLLNYAHPSVVNIIKKMKSRGFVQTENDAKDKRKQLITLTEKSLKIYPKLENLWRSCDTAILNVLNQDISIISYLDGIDNSLKQLSFYDRYKNEYQKQQS